MVSATNRYIVQVRKLLPNKKAFLYTQRLHFDLSVPFSYAFIWFFLYWRLSVVTKLSTL